MAGSGMVEPLGRALRLSAGDVVALQVPLEDLQVASRLLVQALHVRERYMHVSSQSFPTVTARFLRTVGSGNPHALETVKHEDRKTIQGTLEGRSATAPDSALAVGCEGRTATFFPCRQPDQGLSRGCEAIAVELSSPDEKIDRCPTGSLKPVLVPHTLSFGIGFSAFSLHIVTCFSLDSLSFIL